MTRPSKTATADANPSDMQLISKLKSIWALYHNEPSVREAMRLALLDGQVTPSELSTIQASVAFALAECSCSQSAFAQNDNDPELFAEAMALRFEFSPGSEAALALAEILSDGKVTRFEIQGFKAAFLKPGQPAPKPSPEPARGLDFPTPKPSFGRHGDPLDDNDNDFPS